MEVGGGVMYTYDHWLYMQYNVPLQLWLCDSVYLPTPDLSKDIKFWWQLRLTGCWQVGCWLEVAVMTHGINDRQWKAIALIGTVQYS